MFGRGTLQPDGATIDRAPEASAATGALKTPTEADQSAFYRADAGKCLIVAITRCRAF